MHMADALISPQVGATMGAVSIGAIAFAVKKIKKDRFSEDKVPLMAVSAAFIFAAQMINFVIPGTGSSGHIGGGILLACLLGGAPALITLSSVLIIQCLFFADGGLLALGCNIFNMGVIPTLLVFALLFKPILLGDFFGDFFKKKIKKPPIISTGRLSLLSFISVLIALQIGAFLVVLETSASGITEIPFSVFVILMQPIHLAIGVIEGLITAAVVVFVYQVRPEIIYNALGFSKKEALLYMPNDQKGRKATISKKAFLITFGVSAIILATFISLLASANPDGLEWSLQGVTGKTELATKGNIFDTFRSIQEKLAIMPDYHLRGSGNGWSFPGLVGAVSTALLAAIIAYIISFVKKKNRRKNVK